MKSHSTNKQSQATILKSIRKTKDMLKSNFQGFQRAGTVSRCQFCTIVNNSKKLEITNWIEITFCCRVDGRQRHGSSQSDGQRAKSCDSSHSGSSGRHLTGEMIRQLQEQRKGPSQLQPPTTTTTAAAAVAQHHQHLLQMNAAAAAYERALKVSSDNKCK